MNLVKKISVDDSNVISEIHKTCFTENWSENTFRDMLTNIHYFGFSVSDFEENKCGFILCKYIFEEIEIITFCVLPEYRKCGLGRLLINEIIGHMDIICPANQQTHANAKIFLEVSKDNTRAINLYKSAGFKTISERKKYYKTQNGLTDAYVMVLYQATN